MRQPLGFYDCEESLRFYLINCGQGLMHLIVFPDETVMLYDCNVNAEMEDEILAELEKYIPIKSDENGDDYQPIEIFVNSHRDTDHMRGLKKINERFPIGAIWDSGQTGETTGNLDYQYYMGLRRRLKAKDTSNLKVPVPSNEAIDSFGGAEVYCLADAEQFQEVLCESRFQKIQHTNALVLLVMYAGRKMLLTGDSDWHCWKEKIVPNFKGRDCSFEDSDILIASHHGSRSFFTDEDTIDEDDSETTYVDALQLINPSIVLISCGDYSIHHHPNKQAMTLYKKYSKNEQVYCTNTEGCTFVGAIKQDGEYVVSTVKFREEIGRQRAYGFNIICFDESGKRVKNGSYQPIGKKLSFSLESWGGVLNPQENPRIWWQVSNNGVGKDDNHHEIYYKGKKEQSGDDAFRRDLAFEGTHLLRCRVKNVKKGFDETRVFVVKGLG
ncbi:MAG: hypothetical protein J6H31_11375 [Butyrivibrio sp.]|nr:hypothetical protein [Butyrivibrio sp.]